MLNANSEGMVLNYKKNPICVKLSLDLSLIRIILIEKSLCIDGFLKRNRKLRGLHEAHIQIMLAPYLFKI